MGEIGAALKFAWDGSMARANAWAAIPGTALLFALSKLTREPVALPDGFLGLVVGAVTSALAAWVLIFFGRLAYYPIWRRVTPFGGINAYLRQTLGARMWPAILMSSGIAAFVILFGVGAILAMSRPGPWQWTLPLNGVHPDEIGRRLRAVDEAYPLVVVKLQNLGTKGRDLHARLTGIPPATADELLAYSIEARTVLDEVQALGDKYQDYPFIQVVVKSSSVSQEFNAFNAVSSTYNLGIALKGGGHTANAMISENQNAVEFGRVAIQIQNWAGANALELQKARQDILATPIAPTK